LTADFGKHSISAINLTGWCFFWRFFGVDRSSSKQQCEAAPFNRSLRAVAITAATFC